MTPGVPGDSGSAFLDAEGNALGTLSTLAIAPLAGVQRRGRPEQRAGLRPGSTPASPACSWCPAPSRSRPSSEPRPRQLNRQRRPVRDRTGRSLVVAVCAPRTPRSLAGALIAALVGAARRLAVRRGAARGAPRRRRRSPPACRCSPRAPSAPPTSSSPTAPAAPTSATPPTAPASARRPTPTAATPARSRSAPGSGSRPAARSSPPAPRSATARWPTARGAPCAGRHHRREHLRLQRLRAGPGRRRRRRQGQPDRAVLGRPHRPRRAGAAAGARSTPTATPACAPTTVLAPEDRPLARCDHGGWSHDVYTVTPGIPGDSGSGFLDADGRAFGTLSTVAHRAARRLQRGRRPRPRAHFAQRALGHLRAAAGPGPSRSRPCPDARARFGRVSVRIDHEEYAEAVLRSSSRSRAAG